jgi:hypothetical protein
MNTGVTLFEVYFCKTRTILLRNPGGNRTLQKVVTPIYSKWVIICIMLNNVSGVLKLFCYYAGCGDAQAPWVPLPADSVSVDGKHRAHANDISRLMPE